MNENVSHPSLRRSEKSENLERVKKSNYSSFAFLLWTTLWENKKRRDVKSVRIWIDCGWTKLVKSKDVSKVESTPLKISIVTHEPLWRPLWRVRDLIKLHCLAELAFLNLHCRLVDTIGEGLRFGWGSTGIKQCHCFYEYVSSLALPAFAPKWFERKMKMNDSISMEIFQFLAFSPILKVFERKTKLELFGFDRDFQLEMQRRTPTRCIYKYRISLLFANLQSDWKKSSNYSISIEIFN